jgi:transposase-like protein
MDYKSKISLLCPVCKISSFEETGVSYVCSKCNKTFTYSQLEKANEKRINKQIQTVYEKQILPDIAKKINSDLKKAFKGNPYIKIK